MTGATVDARWQAKAAAYVDVRPWIIRMSWQTAAAPPPDSFGR
jgi:hypothetical protein